jgi:hypothetical protein
MSASGVKRTPLIASAVAANDPKRMGGERRLLRELSVSEPIPLIRVGIRGRADVSLFSPICKNTRPLYLSAFARGADGSGRTVKSGGIFHDRDRAPVHRLGDHDVRLFGERDRPVPPV